MPLLEAALNDCAVEGEQPHALAALNGLSTWVQSSLENNEDASSSSNVLKEMKSNAENNNDPNSKVVLEAITAIATGIPRPGHSVIGVGTYRDGKDAWQALAKEYASLPTTDEYYNTKEATLYRTAGGEILNIEHLADTNEAYLKEAGGAMARFIFW